MSDNPYASPVLAESQTTFVEPTEVELASRRIRLLAVIVDGVLLNGLTFPVIFATNLPEKMLAGRLEFHETFAVMTLSTLMWMLLQGYMLAARGQTIGKWLLKIQIVDNTSNCLPPFFHVIVLRYFWTAPILFVCVFMPREAASFMFNLVIVGNGLLILGNDKRCMHDYFADSKVVKFVPTRSKVWGGIRELTEAKNAYDERAGASWELKRLEKRIFYLEKLAIAEERESVLELIDATGMTPEAYLHKTVHLVTSLQHKATDAMTRTRAESFADRIRAIESEIL